MGDNTPTTESLVFVAPNGGPLTLNDLWLRADDQLKIFESIPKDDQVHLRRISIEPSDNLQLRTSVGLRRVLRIEMQMSLRWRHERIALSAVSVVNYRPAAPDDPMPPQVRAEFESTGATTSNVRFGIQFQPGSDNAMVSVQLTPGKE